MAAHAASPVTARGALLRGIYVIFNEEPAIVDRAAGVLRAGVRLLQYRAKRGVDAAHVRELRRLTSAHGALLIFNDDWQAARDFHCDGVHLGPGDEGFDDVAGVRAELPYALIGLSCGTSDEVQRANSGGVDYVGIGSVYATASKSDAGPPIGIDGLRSLTQRSRAPVAAIGGISAARLAEVRAAGVAMAAVIGAVAAAPDAGAAARDLIARWNAAS
ncbi:MAG: thiamine phosphate synthase [Candidatus Eremiobacteraeota bacterium]|nr:thiamine phosphate synthase [Candidatus Eremiobacteraeota bacterium]